VAAARLKVLAALPPELRTRASRISQRFHLDAPGWFQSSEAAPHLQSLSTAVWEDRRVDLRYFRGDGKTVERRTEPLGLVLKGGVWYMVGGAAGQPRTYRVSRIESVTVLDDRFQRPDEFDLGIYWTASIAAYESGVDRLEVAIRIRPDRMEALSEVVGDRAMAGATPTGEPDTEGWARLRLQMEWPDEAHRQLMRLGADLEVLEPLELRTRMADAARSVLRRYETVP
jgi:predicted DNA-binding transcriptional regulator YafY